MRDYNPHRERLADAKLSSESTRRWALWSVAACDRPRAGSHRPLRAAPEEEGGSPEVVGPLSRVLPTLSSLGGMKIEVNPEMLLKTKEELQKDGSKKCQLWVISGLKLDPELGETARNACKSRPQGDKGVRGARMCAPTPRLCKLQLVASGWGFRRLRAWKVATKKEGLTLGSRPSSGTFNSGCR